MYLYASSVCEMCLLSMFFHLNKYTATVFPFSNNFHDFISFFFWHESNLTCVYKTLVSLCRPVIYFNSSSLTGNVHCKVPWGRADSDKHYRNLDLLFVVIITDLVLSTSTIETLICYLLLSSLNQCYHHCYHLFFKLLATYSSQ